MKISELSGDEIQAIQNSVEFGFKRQINSFIDKEKFKYLDEHSRPVFIEKDGSHKSPEVIGVHELRNRINDRRFIDSLSYTQKQPSNMSYILRSEEMQKKGFAFDQIKAIASTIGTGLANFVWTNEYSFMRDLPVCCACEKFKSIYEMFDITVVMYPRPELDATEIKASLHFNSERSCCNALVCYDGRIKTSTKSGWLENKINSVEVDDSEPLHYGISINRDVTHFSEGMGAILDLSDAPISVAPNGTIVRSFVKHDFLDYEELERIEKLNLIDNRATPKTEGGFW